MRVTLLIALIVSLIMPSSLASASHRPYYIEQAAKAFNLDPDLLLAICHIESKCNPNAFRKKDGTKQQRQAGKKSPSYGMFQIKLATARGLGFDQNPNRLVWAENNTYYAAKLIRSLYDRYSSITKVVSAYNAGRYTKTNKKYVSMVLTKYAELKLNRGCK